MGRPRSGIIKYQDYPATWRSSTVTNAVRSVRSTIGTPGRLVRSLKGQSRRYGPVPRFDQGAPLTVRGPHGPSNGGRSPRPRTRASRHA